MKLLGSNPPCRVTTCQNTGFLSQNTGFSPQNTGFSLAPGSATYGNLRENRVTVIGVSLRLSPRPVQSAATSGSARATGAWPSTMLLIFLRREPTPELVIAIAERSLVEYSTAERDKRNNAHISARHEPGTDEGSAGKNPRVRAAPPAPADGVAGQAPKYNPVCCVRGRENECRCTLAR